MASPASAAPNAAPAAPVVTAARPTGPTGSASLELPGRRLAHTVHAVTAATTPRYARRRPVVSFRGSINTNPAARPVETTPCTTLPGSFTRRANPRTPILPRLPTPPHRPPSASAAHDHFRKPFSSQSLSTAHREPRQRHPDTARPSARRPGRGRADRRRHPAAPRPAVPPREGARRRRGRPHPRRDAARRDAGRTGARARRTGVRARRADHRGRARLRTESRVAGECGRSRYGRLEQHRSSQPREGTAGTATMKRLVQVLVLACRLDYRRFSYPLAERSV